MVGEVLKIALNIFEGQEIYNSIYLVSLKECLRRVGVFRVGELF
jgi:hypothetical protein